MKLGGDFNDDVYRARIEATRKPSNANIRVCFGASAFSFDFDVLRRVRPLQTRREGIVLVITLGAVGEDSFGASRSNFNVFFRVMNRVNYVSDASRPPPTNNKTDFKSRYQPFLYMGTASNRRRTRRWVFSLRSVLFFVD